MELEAEMLPHWFLAREKFYICGWILRQPAESESWLFILILFWASGWWHVYSHKHLFSE